MGVKMIRIQCYDKYKVVNSDAEYRSVQGAAVVLHAMIQRPTRDICDCLAGMCIRQRIVYIYEGRMSVSLPRKVLYDTNVRCLTACQHRQPVLFFHCVLKYQPARCVGCCCCSCCTHMMLTMNRRDVAGGSR